MTGRVRAAARWHGWVWLAVAWRWFVALALVPSAPCLALTPPRGRDAHDRYLAVLTSIWF